MKYLAIAAGIGTLVLAGAACGSRADIGLPVDGQATSGAGADSGSGASANSGSGAQGSGAGSSGTQTSGTGASGNASSGTDSSGVGGSSSDGSGPTGAGGASQVCPSFGTACTDCLADACPDTWCSCYENMECLALFQCSGDCGGDQACQQACLTAHEGGISDALLVSDCAGSTCDGACEWGNDVPPCTECIYDSCEDQMNACLAQPACLLLFNCLTDCGPVNLTCQEQCYDDFGDGTALLQEVLECSIAECDQACP